MARIDYEADLTEGERSVRDMVRRFAEQVLRPAGAKLDAMADPKDVIARDSILWDVFKKHRALGIADLAAPNSGLTPAQQAKLRCIISEEMGWGDAGLAIALGVSGFPRMMAQMSEARGDRALQRRGLHRLLGRHRAGPRQRFDLLHEQAGR